VAGTVLVRVIADTTKATAGLDDVASATDKMAEKFDSVGGASAKLAGGLGDLGGGLTALGEKTGNTGLVEMGEQMESLSPIIMGVTGAMDLLGMATKAISGVTKAFTIVQAALNFVMALNPFFLVVIAIVALIAVFIIAYKKSETFRKIVDAAFQGIKKAAVTVFNFVKDFLTGIWNFLKGLFEKGVAFIKNVWAGIGLIFTKTKEVFDKVLGFFSGLWSKIWGFISVIPGKLLAFGKSLMQKILDGLNAGWTWVKGFFSGLWGKIWGLISGIAGKMLDFGKSLMSGIVDGINAGWQWVKNALGDLLGKVLPTWAKKLLGIASPSKVFRSLGQNVSQGFALGIGDGTRAVQRAMSGLVGIPGTSGGSLMVADAGGAGGGRSVVINVNVPATVDASEVGRQVVKAVQSYEKRVGRTYLAGA